MSVTPCTTTNTPRTHKIGISALHDFLATGDTTPVSTAEFAIVDNNHQWTPSFVDDPGNNGTPWAMSEGVVEDKGTGSGALTLIPRADDMRILLPLIMGGAWSTNTLEGDFICQFFTLEAFKGIANDHHRNAKTSVATISSSSTQPILQLNWGIESCQYSRDAAFTSGLSQSLLQPFVHTKSTITIDGVERDVDNISIEINNNLTTDLFYNSTTRTDLPMNSQSITFSHVSPFNITSDLDLHDLGASSVAASIVYTAAAGALSLTFAFPALHSPVPTVITPSGNSPVQNVLTWTARTIGSGGSLQKPVTITLDDVE